MAAQAFTTREGSWDLIQYNSSPVLKPHCGYKTILRPSRFISTMGFLILVRHVYIESAPCIFCGSQGKFSHETNTHLIATKSIWCLCDSKPNVYRHSKVLKQTSHALVVRSPFGFALHILSFLQKVYFYYVNYGLKPWEKYSVLNVFAIVASDQIYMQMENKCENECDIHPVMICKLMPDYIQ